jgi:hypothetical protein
MPSQHNVGGGAMSDLLDAVDRPMAEFSPCRRYRYILRRQWSAARPVGFVLLNPSTADETQDDPTIRRCIGYAKAWGAGGLVLGNLFGLRSTDPRALRSHDDPVGPGNDAALLYMVGEIDRAPLICGWGSHGTFMGRGKEVLARLREWGATPMALTQTASGEPGHPLYLRADAKPVEIADAAVGR